jgi:hypothetical protein
MEKVSSAIEVVLAATDFWRCVLNCAKLFSETNSEKKTNHLKIPGIDAKVLTFKESSYFVRSLYKTCGVAINRNPTQRIYFKSEPISLSTMHCEWLSCYRQLLHTLQLLLSAFPPDLSGLLLCRRVLLSWSYCHRLSRKYWFQ